MSRSDLDGSVSLGAILAALGREAPDERDGISPLGYEAAGASAARSARDVRDASADLGRADAAFGLPRIPDSLMHGTSAARAASSAFSDYEAPLRFPSSAAKAEVGVEAMEKARDEALSLIARQRDEALREFRQAALREAADAQRGVLSTIDKARGEAVRDIGSAQGGVKRVAEEACDAAVQAVGSAQAKAKREVQELHAENARSLGELQKSVVQSMARSREAAAQSLDAARRAAISEIEDSRHEAEAAMIEAGQLIVEEAQAARDEAVQRLAQELLSAQGGLADSRKLAERSVEEGRRSALRAVAEAGQACVAEAQSASERLASAYDETHREALGSLGVTKDHALEELSAALQAALRGVEERRRSADRQVGESRQVALKAVSDAQDAAVNEIAAERQRAVKASDDVRRAAECAQGEAARLTGLKDAALKSFADARDEANMAARQALSLADAQEAAMTVFREAHEAALRDMLAAQEEARRAADAAREAARMAATETQVLANARAMAVSSLGETREQAVFAISSARDEALRELSQAKGGKEGGSGKFGGLFGRRARDAADEAARKVAEGGEDLKERTAEYRERRRVEEASAGEVTGQAADLFAEDVRRGSHVKILPSGVPVVEPAAIAPAPSYDAPYSGVAVPTPTRGSYAEAGAPGSVNPRLTAEGQEFLDEIDESVNWDYGLLEADRRRKRRNKVMLGVAASLVVLAGVGVGGWYLDKEGIIDVPFELDVTGVVEDVKGVLGLGGVTGVGGAAGAAGDPGGFVEGPYPPEGSDEFGYADDMWEGQTVYDYSMISGEGRVIPVTETVEFGPGGLCEISTIRASFDTEEEALSFVDNVHATYGADLIDAVAEGFEAVVTVDVSANALSPEGYEQALSATVEDLVVIESY